MIDMQLRDYQVSARDAVWSAFKSGTRSGLMLMATGCGKTYTCGAIIEPLHRYGKKVLFIAHRAELLEQARKTFERLGMSCAYEKADRKVDVSDLPDVTLAGVQSLYDKRRARFPKDAFHLVVIDETHRASKENSYSRVLEHFSTAKILGLTATPDRADGKGLDKIYERVLFRLDLGEAVARGILCPIEVGTVAVEALDLSEIKTTCGDFAQGELQAEILRDAVLHGMAKPLAEHTAGRKIIAFLPGVASAHRFVEVAAGYGITGVAVDGGMEPEARAAALARYESGEVQMIANCDLLSEGYDHPRTDCVALCSPTKSRGRMVQRIGRGTRLHPDKENLLIVNFAPGTLKKGDLEAPEDALAGCQWKQRFMDGKTYRAKRAEAEQLEEMTAGQAAAAKRRLVATVGVEYAITRMTLADFIAATVDTTPTTEVSPPAKTQLALLRKLGLDTDAHGELTEASAAVVIAALRKRQEAGLCSLKQARFLAKYGYPDTMTALDAAVAFERIRRNNWRPIESKSSAANYVRKQEPLELERMEALHAAVTAP